MDKSGENAVTSMSLTRDNSRVAELPTKTAAAQLGTAARTADRRGWTSIVGFVESTMRQYDQDSQLQRDHFRRPILDNL
jgi:hypothetical protein